MSPKVKTCGILGIILIGVALVAQHLITNREIPTGIGKISAQAAGTADQFSQEEILDCLKLNCWADIFPGTTTLTKARMILETRYGKEKVVDRPLGLRWEFESRKGTIQGGWLNATEQGIVYEINITFSKDDVSVAELVTQVGEPSSVYIVRTISAKLQCAGSLLSFPSIGVMAWLYPINTSIGVQPTQSVSSLRLLPVEQAKKWTVTDHIRLEWRGYRDYCSLVSR